MRIEAAKNHLLLSHESMADIAAAVGFNDPNYFSRIFHRSSGYLLQNLDVGFTKIYKTALSLRPLPNELSQN